MTYDNNGNLATLTENRQTTTYTWDARDRLASLSGPGLTASFAYDGKGRRTQKTITGFISTFQYDGADIVREVAGGSGVSYLRGLAIDEHLARIEDGGSTTCYAPDALGSTVALTDSGGGVATEYTYEPFGRTVASGAPSLNSFQFTGRENDATGLFYYRARYYRPEVARFISEDPLNAATIQLPTAVLPASQIQSLGLLSATHDGRPPGLGKVGGCTPEGQGNSNANLLFPLLSRGQELLHPYAYVGNSPFSFIDPLGYQKNPVCDVICGLILTWVCRKLRIPNPWLRVACVILGIAVCLVLCGEWEEQKVDLLGSAVPDVLGPRKDLPRVRGSGL